MWRSLLKVCPSAHLYVVAFDEVCLNFLKMAKLSNVTVISLSEFEDPDLIAIKKERNFMEYCWTCTSSVIFYCIKKYGLDCCTYVDADLQFFSDPRRLIDEMEEDAVLITPHRYTQKYDQTDIRGKYCVQFMTFKNNPQGMHILMWWREACLKWCYDRIEDEKFGDQKYLDHWVTRFEGVYECCSLGAGVAPWNVQRYVFYSRDGKLLAKEGGKKDCFDVIFYHFHEVRFYAREIGLGQYWIPKNAMVRLYFPYLMEIWRAETFIKKLLNSSQRSPSGFDLDILTVARLFKRLIFADRYL